MTLQATPSSDTQPALSLVTDVRVRNWASELVLECLDDPLTRRKYELVYTKCREIRWSLDTEAVAAEATEADIIGFCPGQAGYAQPAVLTTDLFEVSVLYDHLEIRELTGEPSRAGREPAHAGG